MGDTDLEAASAEGAALSTEEAIAYAQRGRGRGERKRPASGWASLTLFVSPRNVQSHLTHVYTKLGRTSRVQLVREARRHT
jgi:DNA-binding CsgD family transcriptional regulator